MKNMIFWYIAPDSDSNSTGSSGDPKIQTMTSKRKWNLVITRGFAYAEDGERTRRCVPFDRWKKTKKNFSRTPGWLAARPSADELSPASGGGSLLDTLSSFWASYLHHIWGVPSEKINISGQQNRYRSAIEHRHKTKCGSFIIPISISKLP